MIDFKYLKTVMHEFHVFGKNKENKEISLLKTLLKRKQRKDTSPIRAFQIQFKFILGTLSNVCSTLY
jgi:hypothetical protein